MLPPPVLRRDEGESSGASPDDGRDWKHLLLSLVGQISIKPSGLCRGGVVAPQEGTLQGRWRAWLSGGRGSAATRLSVRAIDPFDEHGNPLANASNGVGHQMENHGAVARPYRIAEWVVAEGSNV